MRSTNPEMARPRKHGGRRLISGDAWMRTILLTVSALMLVGAALAGVVHAQTTDVEIDSAVYERDSNTLVLNFTGQFNKFTVSMAEISVADGSCAFTMTWQEYNAPALNSTSIIIRPNEGHQETLSNMYEPTIRVGAGAFETLKDGTPLAPTSLPLVMVGAEPTNPGPCVITYDFNNSLLDVYAVNQTEMLQAIHDGFNVWAELNSELEFAWVDGPNPLIWINLDEYRHSHVGQACLDCLTNGAEMDITLYRYNCRDERVHHTPEYMQFVVAHEFGHIIGLGHHPNSTHLMYAFDDEYTVDPFPTLGYTIPEIQPEWRFIGERELVEKLHSVNATRNEAIDDYGRFADLHGDRRSGVIHFDAQNIDQAQRLYDEITNLTDQFTMIANELNCMRDIPLPDATIEVCPISNIVTLDGQPLECRDVPARTPIDVCYITPSSDHEVCEPVRTPPTSVSCQMDIVETTDGVIESVTYTYELGLE